MSRVLLLDCDGVVADCDEAVHDFAQDVLERDLPLPSTWSDFDFGTAMGMNGKEESLFHECMLSHFDPDSIRLYPDAAEQVLELKKLATVVFVTAPWKRMSGWMYSRETLLEHLDCEVVMTHSKHRVIGDWLVDDRASTIERGGPWEGILFNRPANRSSCYSGRRVSSLIELKEMIR